MVDPSTHYDLGRLNVLVEYNPDREMWLVSALRRATARFKSAGVVAWCSSATMAQELAHLIIGIEIARDGAAIWPDGRTEPDPTVPTEEELDGIQLVAARDLIRRLLGWVEWSWPAESCNSPVYREAQEFLGGPEPEYDERCAAHVDKADKL